MIMDMNIFFFKAWSFISLVGSRYTAKDNARIGDVCYLMTPSKYGKNKFKLCHVVQFIPDEHGAVRRVEVKMRTKQKNELTLPYRQTDPEAIIEEIQNNPDEDKASRIYKGFGFPIFRVFLHNPPVSTAFAKNTKEFPKLYTKNLSFSQGPPKMNRLR